MAMDCSPFARAFAVVVVDEAGSNNLLDCWGSWQANLIDVLRAFEPDGDGTRSCSATDEAKNIEKAGNFLIFILASEFLPFLLRVNGNCSHDWCFIETETGVVL